FKFMFFTFLFTFFFPNANSLKIILLNFENCDINPLINHIKENQPRTEIKLFSENSDIRINDLIFICTDANCIEDLKEQLNNTIAKIPNFNEYKYNCIAVINIRKNISIQNNYSIFKLEEFDNDLIEKIAEIQNYNKFEFPEEKKSIISYIKIKEDDEKIEETEEENIKIFVNIIFKLGKMCNCEYQSFLEQFRNNFTEEEQKYIYSYDQYSYANKDNLYKTIFNMFTFNKYNVLKKIIK
ncbi:MAG: hypothetical protein Q4B84_02430, partial [Clostridia bacterium]|nr:hypothetical protein [Clostridia bacterium]